MLDGGERISIFFVTWSPQYLEECVFIVVEADVGSTREDEYMMST